MVSETTSICGSIELMAGIKKPWLITSSEAVKRGRVDLAEF